MISEKEALLKRQHSLERGYRGHQLKTRAWIFSRVSKEAKAGGKEHQDQRANPTEVTHRVSPQDELRKHFTELPCERMSGGQWLSAPEAANAGAEATNATISHSPVLDDADSR